MSDHTLLGPWVRRFLLEHVVAERNLARNTQHSYRDALAILIPFVSKARHSSVDQLAVVDVSAELVRQFLADIETARGCRAATRNQRLAAIRALAGFIGEHSPEHIGWSGQIRSIPFKKTGRTVVPYLDKPEMDDWPPQIPGPNKADGSTLCSYFYTTPALVPPRRPS
jgi:site-specific recombinase XerD